MIAAVSARTLLLFLPISLAAVGCSGPQSAVTLRCDYGNGLQDVYALAPNTDSVRLMTVNPPRPGVLKVTDAAYTLEFPEDHPAPGYMLLKVDINRFTSKADRVIGRDRTVEYQGQTLELRAMSDSGTCAQTEGAVF